MSVSFDTSVLVAGLVEQHSHHERAIPWLEAASKGDLEAECSWHAVAETWAVLTRLPMDPAIPPSMAEVAIERLLRFIKPVVLDSSDYEAAIRRCTESGQRSGAIFDALHLLCAESHEAECLLTFNARDFRRLTQEGSPRIVVPPDPPEVRM